MDSIGHILAGFTRKRLLVLAAMGIFAVACGATGTGSGSNPSPAPSAGLGFDVTVTENDHAVTMHPGQKLEVVLHAPNGMNNWSHPESHDTSVLSPTVDPAATAARGVTLAGFEAKQAGPGQNTSKASPHRPPRP